VAGGSAAAAAAGAAVGSRFAIILHTAAQAFISTLRLIYSPSSGSLSPAGHFFGQL